jgi:hypothetical protein
VAGFEARRLASVGLMVLGMTVSGVSCSSTARDASRFCRAVGAPDTGFDSRRPADQVAALERVMRAVPARDRADLRAIRDFMLLPRDAGGLTTEEIEARATRYGRAVHALDQRLVDECHVVLNGPRGAIFNAVATTTTRGGGSP